MIIPFRQSPNYTKGGSPRACYVLHGTLGGYKGAIETLCATVRKDSTGKDIGKASAHYVIGQKEGEIICLVKTEDTAWHCGIVDKPNTRGKSVLQKEGTKYKNPNKHTIGIEFQWGVDSNKNRKIDPEERTLTDWQKKVFIELVSSLPYPKVFVSHKDITSYKSDDLTEHVEYFTEYFKPKPVQKIESVSAPTPPIVNKSWLKRLFC